MPIHNMVDNEQDLAYQLTEMDPLMVQHALAQRGYGTPQPGQSALPRTMAQYQPMQRPQAPQARSPQANRTDEQLGLALMLSGRESLADVGKTLFPKTLGAGDGYKEQMADIRHQEQMQQRYAQMNQPKTPLVSNVNTVGGSQPGWEPLGTSGQFYRADSQGVPEVFAAPGSTAHNTQVSDAADVGRQQFQRGQRALQVAPQLLQEVTQAIDLIDNVGPIRGKLVQYGRGDPSGPVDTLLRGGALTAAGGTHALNTLLQSIRGNISIDALQGIRDMSPTGGALGQIPMAQMDVLMGLQGGIDPTLPPEQLRATLTNVQNNYRRYLSYAMWGEDYEWDRAIALGKATPQQAMEAKQQRDAMLMESYTPTGFDIMGRREPEGAQPPPDMRYGPAFNQQGGDPPPMDVEVNTPRMGSGPVQVQSIEEAMALPPGTPFIDPQGTPRIR